MMAAAKINGSGTGSPKSHLFGWPRVVQNATNNLMGPASSNDEQLAAARVRTWMERHIYM